MTRTGKVQKLKTHIPKPYLEINPEDALLRRIKDDDLVEVFNARGSVRVRATVTSDIKKGVVFLPMHWGKMFMQDRSRANNLTNNLVDPKSKQPDYKYSATQVIKYRQAKQKIVIVGAGAGAYRFVNSYRNSNQEDELHILSDETENFYNRVLLPEYISGQLSWNDLEKFKEDELKQLNVHLHSGLRGANIDRKNKRILDSNGVNHSYDKLVLATGSRAFLPETIPCLPGIFSVRKRDDADAIRDYTNEGDQVLIVGGGLLGLELAASLSDIGIGITILQRSDKLMGRQLDRLARDLLIEEIKERGIQLRLNDEIRTITADETTQELKVVLTSGNDFKCKAAVVTIGTRPNIEIAKKADLDCQRGVTVNDYLQTSDPDIFAIGEIAEYQGTLNGITAAAEDQADGAANYMSGDPSSPYQGTLSMNILKFADLELCSLGIVEPPENRGYDEILFIDKINRVYKKCVIKNDRLVGAILMGDKSEFAEYRNLIQNRTELAEKRLELLRSGTAREPILGKQICSCNNVGEGNIIKAVESGCDQLTKLCQATGAGLGCGSCKPEVQAILAKVLTPTERASAIS